MNKTKIIITVAAIGIGGLMLTTALTLKLLDKEPLPNPESPIVSSEDGPILNPYPEIPELNTINEVPSNVGNKDGGVLPEGVALSIEIEAREFIRTFKFEKAEELIVSKIQDYDIQNSDAYKKILEPIRLDLPSLSQFDYLREYNDNAMIEDMIKRMVDPTNLLVASLWVDNQSRENILISEDSLNPIFEEINEIGPISKTNTPIDGFTGAEDVYEIPLMLDGYKLKAIVINEYGWLYLHSINEVEGVESPFITIKEWKTLRGEVLGEEPVVENPNEIEQIQEEGMSIDGENP